MTTMTQAPTNIVFSDSAAAKVAQLIDEEQNSKLNLRVYITGGGCSGFQYGFTFDEDIQPDQDHVVEKTIDKKSQRTVKLLIDPMSYLYLQGAEIDYREDINGAQFIIRNPNAKTTCGCGASFSVEDEQEEE